MGRLAGFDYKSPYFYMVTLKKHHEVAPFSQIASGAEVALDGNGRKRYLVANEITYAFAKTIKEFAGRWRGLSPIETFVVMPDHIHILFHIKESGDQLALGSYVYQLEKALAKEYWKVLGRMGAPQQNSDGVLRVNTGAGLLGAGNMAGANQSGAGAPSCAHIFEADWHDWIVKADGQLAAFTRYIRENPKRAWLRAQNRRFFGEVRQIKFAGRDWFAYGNDALLELPVVKPFKCSRKWTKGGEEWNMALAEAERIGPGGAGVGTFMSPCEKECGNAIFKAGGSLIMLSPEGFGERWHPARNKEALCAKGRMLFLSLYGPQAAKPDNATLYRRCHEMGDVVALAQ